jgi:hypothetical protein
MNAINELRLLVCQTAYAIPVHYGPGHLKTNSEMAAKERREKPDVIPPMPVGVADSPNSTLIFSSFALSAFSRG